MKYKIPKIRNQVSIKVSRETYDLLRARKEKTGASIKWTVDRLVKQNLKEEENHD